MRACASHGRAGLQSSRMFVVTRTKTARARSGSMDARLPRERSRAKVVKVVTSTRAGASLQSSRMFVVTRTKLARARSGSAAKRSERAPEEEDVEEAGECARDMTRSNNHKMGAVGQAFLRAGNRLQGVPIVYRAGSRLHGVPIVYRAGASGSRHERKTSGGINILCGVIHQHRYCGLKPQYRLFRRADEQTAV